MVNYPLYLREDVIVIKSDFFIKNDVIEIADDDGDDDDNAVDDSEIVEIVDVCSLSEDPILCRKRGTPKTEEEHRPSVIRCACNKCNPLDIAEGIMPRLCNNYAFECEQLKEKERSLKS